MTLGAPASILRPRRPDHAGPVGVVVVASGGLDSTVLAHWLDRRGEVVLVSVDYGQRHRCELAYAAETAATLDVAHHVVDLSSYGALLRGCALTDSGAAMPDGHYTDESIWATVVPNRNAVLLDIAVGVAITVEADAVAYGAHAGDHIVYPDCRPAFVAAYGRMVALANEGQLPSGFRVLAPFVRMSKGQIVALGCHLGVPLARTWSCYRGGEVHCGSCGTCVERREAFAVAGVADPTVYTGIDGRVG